MSNRFISSHGIGEIYLDPFDMTWCMFDSSYFDEKKELPLFQFVLDLASLMFRYDDSIVNKNIWNRTLIGDLHNIIKEMVFIFVKITSLSNDLFCTGDIATAKDCVKSFEQFMNKESFDFFDFGEIKQIIDLIDIELSNFKKLLICPFFIKNCKKYRDIYIEIMEDFKYPLKNR